MQIFRFISFKGEFLWALEITGEVVKTTTLQKDPPNHKIVGGVCLHPPCLMSKDGVFVA